MDEEMKNTVESFRVVLIQSFHKDLSKYAVFI
jgi:hypothetical protein